MGAGMLSAGVPLWGTREDATRDRKTKEGRIAKMFGEPGAKARFEVIGVLATGSMPEELAAKTRADTEMWAPIIKAANIRVE
jgi:tripartite-type tricarboxylate transporter receptor subunit TctC